MQSEPERTPASPSELVHHGLVLLLLSLALWLCLSHLVPPLLTPGRAREAGWPRLTLAALGALAAGTAYFLHLAWWRSGRWRGRSGAPFRLLLYCLVAQWAAFVAYFPSFDRASFAATATAAAGAFSLLLLLRPAKHRLVSALDLAAFYLCVLLVGGEVALRATAWLRPSVLLTRADDAPAKRIAAARSAPGRLRWGFPVNRRGYYDVDLDDGPHDGPLVVAIGDSFSMGVVPYPYHFTTVAEGRLPGVQVYNMGVAGIGPPEYLHLLRTEALALEPDVVVVNLFVGNDLTFSLPPADEAFLSRWYGRDNVLLYQLFRRLFLLREADLPKPPGEPAAPALEEENKDFPWISDPSLEQANLTAGDFLRIETSRAEELNSLSDVEYQRRFAVLRQIVDAAGAVPVVFLLIPDELQVEDDLWDEVQRRSPRPLARNRGLDVLIDWLKKEGLRYTNLLPLLRSQTPLDDGRLHLYHLRDTHFNARGNRVAGEALAELVRPMVAAPAPSLQIFPVDAEADGGPWVSDLDLFNPGASSTAATLQLTLFAGGSKEVSTLLQPGVPVAVDDLGRRSNLTGAGFVTVRSDAPVVAGLRTYRRLSGGTVGDFVAPLELTGDPIFFTAPAGAERSVHLMIVQPSGGSLTSDLPGVGPSFAVPPPGIRLSALRDLSSGSLAGSAPLAALAAAVDRRSDDLALYPGLRLAGDGALVGLAHVDDAGGRTVRSSLSIYAPDGAELTLAFAAYRSDRTDEPRLRFALAAGETLPIDDVVGRFGLGDAEGVLWYRASRPVLAVAYTLRTGGPGPSGQTVLPSPAVRPGSVAYFLFAARTGTAAEGTRSDLGLANPGASELRLDVRLADDAVTAGRLRSVAVAPGSAVLLEDVVGWLGRDRLAGGVIAVSGDGPFAAQLFLIDLRSGDVTGIRPAMLPP